MVPHLICGGASAEQIESQLQDFKFMGIRNILVLRGDAVPGEKRFTPERDGYAHADELVAAIRRFEAAQAGGLTGFLRCLEAMRLWHRRYVDYLTERGADTAALLRQVPFGPARTFREALQSVWFTLESTSAGLIPLRV